jgi:SAM-dependent methyltransferase
MVAALRGPTGDSDPELPCRAGGPEGSVRYGGVVPGLAEFFDPRLVAIYDTANSYAPDAQPGFYSALATELGAVSIIDLGCGTGIITCELARRGHRLVGVEPAPAMLDLARRRPQGELVTWIEGDASSLGTPGADLAIMTGHVAQFFLTDDAWHCALEALHAALRPGGHLAFESRNPEARAWERWSPAARRVVVDPTIGDVERWAEVHDVRAGVVTYTIYSLVRATGEVIPAPVRLRFRTLDEVTSTLADAGFGVRDVYGDWDRRPSSPGAPELIVVAAR